jgi:hypothetical protein
MFDRLMGKVEVKKKSPFTLQCDVLQSVGCRAKKQWVYFYHQGAVY